MHIGDQLSGYLDSQVDSATRVSIEAHLAECAECRSELAAVSEIRDGMRGLPTLEVPAAVYELEAEVIPLRAGQRRILVAAAAVVALVVGIGFGVSGNQSVPLELNQFMEHHVARASVDPGFNVLQVQAVVNR